MNPSVPAEDFAMIRPALRKLAEKVVASRFGQTVSRFRKGRSGVAAVEFALMVPAMMSVWVGMVVATDALNADKKVTLLTRTLADLTTQMQAISQADADSIFNATEAVLWPQPADKLAMRLISLTIDGAGKVFVDWSVVPTNNALKGHFSALARCSAYSGLPAALKVARTSIVLAEVEMKYTASVATEVVDKLFQGSSIGGEMPLKDRLFMRPRQSNNVQFNPAPAGNCPGWVT
jgi:Flp pilus assembly protein TadG